MFPTAFLTFASCWQVVKRKLRNVSNVVCATNVKMQTSQFSWCYCETHDFSTDLTVSQPRPRLSWSTFPDLTVSQPRPHFSWSTVPDHNRPSHTTGDLRHSGNCHNLLSKVWVESLCMSNCNVRHSQPHNGVGLKI